MRLWHKDLLSVLPRQQLLGQWRECCLIAKGISEQGTPNHILVNKIMDYPLSHFIKYSNMVASELKRRNYKCDTKSIEQYLPDFTWNVCYPKTDNLFKDWHNDRYLKQCYYNLQEKYDCSGITKAEWELIESKFSELDDAEKKQPKIQLTETNIFDKETVIENATVQILENTVTGEVSIGWWKNE